MIWFLVKELQIFEIYLYFCHFLPKNFGRSIFLGKFLESSYDCPALAPVSAF